MDLNLLFGTIHKKVSLNLFIIFEVLKLLVLCFCCRSKEILAFGVINVSTTPIQPKA